MKKILIIISLVILVSCGQTEVTNEIINNENISVSSDETIIQEENNSEVLTWVENNETLSYTLEDVSIHNNSSDCWTIVESKVYDISSFFGQHPWGDTALEQLCWTDWTEAFSNKHWWQEWPEMTLDWYYIWDLK